jgi:hypothetical protein
VTVSPNHAGLKTPGCLQSPGSVRLARAPFPGSQRDRPAPGPHRSDPGPSRRNPAAINKREVQGLSTGRNPGAPFSWRHGWSPRGDLILGAGSSRYPVRFHRRRRTPSNRPPPGRDRRRIAVNTDFTDAYLLIAGGLPADALPVRALRPHPDAGPALWRASSGAPVGGLADTVEDGVTGCSTNRRTAARYWGDCYANQAEWHRCATMP